MRNGVFIALCMTAALGAATAGGAQDLSVPPPARPAANGEATSGAASDGVAAPDAATSLAVAPADAETPLPIAAPLIAAARAQVGVTTRYDPSYVSLDYPGGDVPADRGVCTDVLIRALRDGADIDLQLALNRDMVPNFSAYPRNWGLSRTDTNIDHRRVPNLATLFRRLGAEIPDTAGDAEFLPGDVVTMMLPGNLPHILVVSDKLSADGKRPLVIHNIGRGTREEDVLENYPHTGHFRFTGDALAELRRLGQLQN